MSASMAEVILTHRVSRTGHCECGTVLFDTKPERIAIHVAAALAAAGYGKLEDAWDEGHRFTGYEPERNENPHRRPE